MGRGGGLGLEITGGAVKTWFDNRQDIEAAFAREDPFLHLLFEKKGRFVAFCSISNKFFVMDNETFGLFGEKALAKHRMLPFVKHKDYFFAFFPAITSKCNLACTYCLGDEPSRLGKTADWETIKSGIDYIARQKKLVRIILSSAGEQTLEPELLKKTLDYMEKKLQIELSRIATNGANDPALLTTLADRFSRLQISCDGPPEIQDLQRPLKGGKKSSALVEKTIKALVSNKKRFVVKITITGNHVGCEERTFKYFYSLGVQEIGFSTVGSVGLGSEFRKKSSPDSLENLSVSQMKLKELCDVFGLKSRLAVEHYFEHGRQTYYCSIGSSFSLGTDGTIASCLMYSNADDLKIHKGMNELLIGLFDRKSKKIRLDKQKVKKLRTFYKKSECYDCDFKLCWGGCPVMNVEKNGNITKPDNAFCEERKTQTLRLMKYLAERDVIKIRPCLEEKNNKLYYSLQYSEFELAEQGKSQANGSEFVRFSLSQTGLDALAEKIIGKSKKNREKIVLFVLCPIAREKLDIRTSVQFKAFLYTLKENKVIFKISRPVKITDASEEKEGEFYKEFSIPKDCSECLELFRVKDGKIRYCGGIDGPEISEVFDRREAHEIFKKIVKEPNCPRMDKK